MTEDEAVAIQDKLSKELVFTDFIEPADINIVAGFDVEYDKDSDTIAGGIVLIDIHTQTIIESSTHIMKATFPYIPGLFSFREMPPLLYAYEKLKIKPDVIVCDGQGIAHPRGFGLACHIGIVLNIPTIGCAKTRLFGYYETPHVERESSSSLIHEVTNEVIGSVLRTQNNVKPVFVSVGHKISLETANDLVLKLCKYYRLPETTRLADLIAREAIEQYKNSW